MEIGYDKLKNSLEEIAEEATLELEEISSKSKYVTSKKKDAKTC